MEQPKPEAATPASTGGAGTSFEQHVDTAFLALLLVKGMPPCIIDTQVEEVHFQTRHLDWYTDDILIIGRCGDGSKRRLAAQVKRTFCISSIDEDCVSTIDGAWKDFQSSTRFDKSKDAIAIITQRGSERLLAHFGTLLDLARASLDADDFLRRIGQQGFISKIARNYNQEIRKIIESKNGVPIADKDYWEFLKSLRILNFDLNSPTSQVEAWIKTLLAQTASDSNNLDVARATWNELLSLVSRADPIAESFTYDKLPEDLRRIHSPIGRPEHSAIKTLGEHSELVLTRISSIIGPAIHIPRDALCTNLLECLDLNQVVIVTGPAGSGKSAIAKDVIGKLSQEYMVFAFRAEEFAAPHLDETIHRCQIVISSRALFSLLALHSKKLILIESTERLLEKSERESFAHLLQLIREDNGWRIILTCRDYSLDTIRTSFLEYAGLPYSVVNVPLLDDTELNQAIAEIPKLKRPNENPALHKLFLNPYILDKAVRMDWPENAKLPQDERSFRSKVWKEIIREDDKTASGMPMKREEVFLQIALRRAQSLDQFAECSDLDKQALDHLRNSNLIEFSEKTENLAAPAHDVLEDWALIQFLEQRFAIHGLDYSSFLAELGTHPALRRAYRKWLGEMLECEPQAVDNYVLTVISDGNLTQQSRDDTLVSVMLSSNAVGFISRNDMMLLQENANLLRRMIHLLRVACRTLPNWLPSKDTSLALLVPQGRAWAAILKCTRQNLVIFIDNDLALLVGLLEDWSQGVNFWYMLNRLSITRLLRANLPISACKGH
ncbi:MAG: ATP-binding protein [Methanothrix sp.]